MDPVLSSRESVVSLDLVCSWRGPCEGRVSSMCISVGFIRDGSEVGVFAVSRVALSLCIA